MEPRAQVPLPTSPGLGDRQRPNPSIGSASCTPPPFFPFPSPPSLSCGARSSVALGWGAGGQHQEQGWSPRNTWSICTRKSGVQDW